MKSYGKIKPLRQPKLKKEIKYKEEIKDKPKIIKQQSFKRVKRNGTRKK